MIDCLVKDQRASIEFARDYFHGKTDSIAEVGVLLGGNASYMQQALNPDKIYLIDKIRAADLKNSIWLIGNSVRMATYIPDGTLDLAYIDANHSFQSCLADIIAYYPKIRVGGILCGHDWLEKYRNEGVARACDLFFGKDNYLVEQNSTDWWVVKKKERNQ
jgi:predicted O-methyltransferase YrrM